MMKSDTLSVMPARTGFQFRLWWFLAFLVVALPLGTVVQTWRMILPPSDCNQRGDKTSSGTVVQFCFPSLTPQYGQGNITVGPDGNLWFSEMNKIGRITPTGQLAEFPAQSIYSPIVTGLIVRGPDGNLWFLEGNAMVRMSPDGVSENFGAGVIESPTALTVGSDRNLWFSAPPGQIGRITPHGDAKLLTLPAQAQIGGLAAAPDGHLWFLNAGDTQRGSIWWVHIGRLTL